MYRMGGTLQILRRSLHSTGKSGEHVIYLKVVADSEPDQGPGAITLALSVTYLKVVVGI
jgi:hypothetical protein